MTDRQSIIVRLGLALRGAVRRLFPARQILVRDQATVRCFRLGTIHQILIVAAVSGCVLWALLATAAYLDGLATVASKDDEIAHRAAELDGLKGSYQAAFSRLDEFQSIFQGISCEISDIQDSLLRITERTMGSGKRAAANLPRLDPDAKGCRTVAADQPAAEGTVAAQRQTDTRRIVGSLKDAGNSEQQSLRRRVGELEEALARLKASHGAFLQHSSDLAASRIGELERGLSSVGVDPRHLISGSLQRARTSDTAANPYGRGGPFIAAGVGQRAWPDLLTPIALFNSHAERLDTLTSALRTLPLGEPLADYEVTSPFGARNDPINWQTGFHEGVDLGAPTGTPVMATGDGQVIWAAWRDRYGLMVELEHGVNTKTRYAHLSKVLVTVGEHVKRGSPVGLVGETGRTTGPHLHYEVRIGDQPVNPMKFITAGQDVLKGQ